MCDREGDVRAQQVCESPVTTFEPMGVEAYRFTPPTVRPLTPGAILGGVNACGFHTAGSQREHHARAGVTEAQANEVGHDRLRACSQVNAAATSGSPL